MIVVWSYEVGIEKNVEKEKEIWIGKGFGNFYFLGREI